MPKTPDSVPVKITVSKITLEVPKAFFEHSALRAAVLVGRKGRSAATRRTKWFTLADPALVPSRTRQSVALPTSSLGGVRRASMALEGEDSAEQRHIDEVPVEMAVLEYSGVNNVVYDVDMKPLNVFEGDWVFDQKTTHPLTIFAKLLVKNRPGVRTFGGKSDQESNLNEVLQMDQEDMESEEGESDHFSDGHEEVGAQNGGALEMSLTGMDLTEAQLAALSGEANPNEMVMNQLRRGEDCKRRYLQFPKTIDVATIVNTKAKTMDYCERLTCKNAALLGATLSFTVTAELPHEKLAKYEDKVKSKEGKEEMRRREKEEKIIEKECKREEKEEKKRREKADAKSGKKEKNYGADLTETPHPSGSKGKLKDAQVAAAPPQPPQQQPSTPDSSKKKSGFSPFQLVKGIFAKEEKPVQATPFTLKLTSTPYPFLVMLYDFELSKLVKEPVNYRAVHIRLGSDSPSTEVFPRLLLDATKPSAKTESTITWHDGSVRDVISFKFGQSRIFFGDKAIRHITGFETLRALQEHERQYHEAKKAATEEGLGSQRRQSVDNDLFREQLMNIGTQFQSVAFEPTKYSTGGNQALATKFTRVTAQLIVASKVVGEVRQSDAAETAAYINKLKKAQKQREKEEKERLKAEKAAKKAEKKQGDAAATGAAGDADSSSNTQREAETSTTASKNPGTPSASAANRASAKDGNGMRESDGTEKEGEDQQTFEASAADHVDPTAEVAATSEADKRGKKEGREKDGDRIVLNQSSSFQLSTYVINEDYMPKDGLPYRILFHTGEELSFRARRFFLPSVCVFGDDGCTREQTLDGYMSSAAE
ncbi:hypothetical protein ABL78_4917 [Leptomonas seymouri]|uniref:Uncharacterized protein n=1 Tax=Leptomonas seymouri TaxID=5684 RepID=A0A0N1I5N8_LEPSE|nr:hypothetical protein ABL78_4917 [Leptomonas seymouri]|eukprot:KPI86014.1 hypothetical protein ABL78_4917 [Leptomonas seymouri]